MQAYISAHLSLINKYQRRARKFSVVSDSDDSDVHDDKESLRRGGVASSDRKASPASSTHLKRKSNAASQGPAKRKKSSDAPITVEDDPVRKHCLGKLHEMLSPIFLRYPYTDAPDGAGNKVHLNPDDVTDEIKQHLEDQAKVFASELEQSMFDVYAEPDKYGKQAPGPKYKYVVWVLNHFKH